MKYVDADKIRAEIERLYEEYKDKFHRSGDSYHLGLIDGLDMAERVLDTLESEEPTLTWGDVQLLDTFILECAREEREGKDWGESEEFYTEVLRRYNDFVKRTIPEIVSKIHEYNEHDRKDSPEN